MKQRDPTKWTIAEVFSRQAQCPYLIEADSGEIWTYHCVLTAALRVVADWRSQGAVEQDKIAFCLDNSIEYAVCYLAVILGKFIAVPINTGLTGPEIDYILAQTEPRIIVGTDDFLNAHSEFTRRATGVSVAKINAIVHQRTEKMASAESAFPALDRSLTVSIHYTSGTTGKPKGVVHGLGPLLESACAFNIATGITSENRFLHHLPMSYMAGFLNTLLCPLVAGASVVVQRVFDPTMALQYWSLAEQRGVNTLWLVPSMATLLLKLDRRPQDPSFYQEMIRLACIGTAPVPARLWTEFKQRYGLELQESFGLSETLFVSTNSPCLPQKGGSVGKLLSGVTLQIIDGEGNVLQPHQTGQIQIKTSFLMKGYFRDDRAGEQQEWFDSGDLGHLDEEGYLFITGRKKDLIIRGGINVSPRALEEGFLDHPWVEQVAVIGLPNDVRGEEIFVLLKPKISSLPESWSDILAGYAREKFASHCQPDRFLLVKEFPIGVSGKILKNQLREELLQSHGTKNR
jgi:acyl-coenzyme A synthetase/AMP-(fatty) acid ligase